MIFGVLIQIGNRGALVGYGESNFTANSGGDLNIDFALGRRCSYGFVERFPNDGLSFILKGFDKNRLCR